MLDFIQLVLHLAEALIHLGTTGLHLHDLVLLALGLAHAQLLAATLLLIILFEPGEKLILVVDGGHRHRDARARGPLVPVSLGEESVIGVAVEQHGLEPVGVGQLLLDVLGEGSYLGLLLIVDLVVPYPLLDRLVNGICKLLSRGRLGYLPGSHLTLLGAPYLALSNLHHELEGADRILGAGHVPAVPDHGLVVAGPVEDGLHLLVAG